MEDMLKFNADGSERGKPGFLAGCGGVLIDSGELI